MSTIRIADLPSNRTLDRTAMTRLRGAGGSGGWVAGWIIPFSGVASVSSNGGNTLAVSSTKCNTGLMN